MAQVVQVKCPSCKTVLRIPAEWLGQPIRCKQCGTTLQTKGSAAPAVNASTPLPAPRPGKKAPPPAPPVPAAIKAAQPVSASPPMAAPVGRRSAGASFDFGGDADEAATTTTPRKRRRRGNGTVWVGLGMVVALIAVTLGLGVAFWPKIQKAIKENQAAKVNQKIEDDDPPPARDGGKPGGNTDGAAKDGSKTKDGSPVVPPSDKSKIRPKTKDKKDKDDPPPFVAKGLFPRRALIISVHNYLYANPIMTGEEGTSAVPRLTSSLNRGLNIPMNQIYHIADAAKKSPLPPLKPVIEQSLTNFLKTCRKQDRIMVFFIGHAREIDDKAYLVPLEGDFKDASTLIPLEWVYKQLADCPARQKILVIDGNRYNAGQGEERPAAGEMGAKFETALKTPPAGVQVWSACSAAQQSHEFDESALGLFLDSFRLALTPERDKGYKGALDGKIQRQDDLIPLDVFQERVAENMGKQIEKRKLKQVAFLAGKAPAEGSAYDKDEALAQAPAFPSFKPESQQAVKDILAEVSLPPLKSGQKVGADLDFNSLPPFPPEALKKYEGTLAAESKLKKAIHNGRVALWAIAQATAPPDLQIDVAAFRKKMGDRDLGIMKDKYSHPGGGAAETRFKERVANDGKAMARIIAALEDVRDELKEAGEEKDAAPARWQANYAYVYGRFLAQLTYLEEYQALLGSIRREFPTPYDANVNSGFKMAAKEKATDSLAKKYFKEMKTNYTELVDKNKGTPWEVLGKREQLTSLGLEWQAY